MTDSNTYVFPSELASLTLSDICSGTFDALGKVPCLWQVKLCHAQIQSRVVSPHQDIISISATGSGKTLTFFMPLVFCKEGITIVVTALNVLGDQFVREAGEAKFSGVSVTAENDNDKTFEVHKFHTCSYDHLPNFFLGYTEPQVPHCCLQPRNPYPTRWSM